MSPRIASVSFAVLAWWPSRVSRAHRAPDFRLADPIQDLARLSHRSLCQGDIGAGHHQPPAGQLAAAVCRPNVLLQTRILARAARPTNAGSPPRPRMSGTAGTVTTETRPLLIKPVRVDPVGRPSNYAAIDIVASRARGPQRSHHVDRSVARSTALNSARAHDREAESGERSAWVRCPRPCGRRGCSWDAGRVGCGHGRSASSCAGRRAGRRSVRPGGRHRHRA
jgi:hypothetical protein